MYNNHYFLRFALTAGRGKRKVRRPSPGTVESNSEGFITIEPFDQRQGLFSSDRDCGGQRVGEAEVGPGDARRGDTRSWLSGMRINQMMAALVGARSCNCPGKLDDAGEVSRGRGIDDADPERFGELGIGR